MIEAGVMATPIVPSWLSAFATGEKSGWAQAVMAYADYYCVDGSADDDPEIDERLVMHRPPMVGYASRTGTRRNLDALAGAEWRLLVSARGERRPEGMRYAIGNGAWTAYQRGEAFDESAFLAVVEKLGEGADWIVLPDIVQGGLASLEYSLRWMDRLRGMPTQLLIAVQDGMQLDDVARFLSPVAGIFIGGSTEWKEATAEAWGLLARRRNGHLHVGRVNSARRIHISAAAGANSFDGSGPSRFSNALPRLDRAKRQPDLFAAADQSLADAQAGSMDLVL
jgi:hypothetical protein